VKMLKSLVKDSWDSPPTYDTIVDDEDLVGSSLSYNQENRLDEVSLSDST
jgi:hypothetical protein